MGMCRKRFRNIDMIYICKNGNKSFVDYKCNRRVCCSKKCIDEYKKRLVGKNNPRYTSIEKECLICGKRFTVKNYRKDTAKFCCKKCSEIDRDEGKSTENEKIRKSIEYRLWREAVFARDNWTCQKTKIKGEKLHPHHILNFSDYPELRFAIDNGITLSEEAHKEFHKRYGFKNNTKKQLNDFL